MVGKFRSAGPTQYRLGLPGTSSRLSPAKVYSSRIHAGVRRGLARSDPLPPTVSGHSVRHYDGHEDCTVVRFEQAGHAVQWKESREGRVSSRISRSGERRLRSAAHTWISLTVLFAALSAPAREPVAPPRPLSLEWCLERAEAENADLAWQAAAWSAAQHRVAQDGALEDPRFGYQASNIPIDDFDFDSTSLSGHQLTLAQKFPFPGQLRSQRRAALAGTRAAAGALDERRNQVASVVERTWAALGFAQRALEITDSNLELLRQLTQIAEAKYRVGTGLQQDVIRAQVELTRLLELRIRRDTAIHLAEARLAELLDLPPETPLPTTASLIDSAPIPDLAAILARLDETSPRLRGLSARVEQAERLRASARLAGFPDFDLGIGYRVRERVAGDPVNGDDFVSAGVTLRLPINRRKWGALVAERDALWRQARSEARAARAQLRQQVRVAHAELEQADSTASLLETGLVPQARQSLESHRSGYQVDKVDFLSLINSQVRLLDAELSLVRAQADRRSAFATLEWASGEKLR